MAKYDNLPGIEVEIADGGLILPEDATTESLLIIAPCENEDTPEQPMAVRQSSDLTTMGFGGFVVNGKVNQIAVAWKAAFDGGARNISLLALKGSTDEERFTYLQDVLFGILEDYSVQNIVAVGVYADKEAVLTDTSSLREEGVKTEQTLVAASTVSYPLVVEAGSDTITVSGKTITVTAKTYSKPEYLLDEIRRELKAQNLVDMEVYSSNSRLRFVQVGKTPFEVAAGTLDLGIEGTSTGSSVGSFAQILATYAEMQTVQLGSTVAYIGTTAPVSNTLKDVKDHVDYLSSIHNEYSGHLQVFAGPEFGYQVQGRTDLFLMNGVVAYAALVTTLKAESATTNKTLTGMTTVNYNLSLRQLNTLTGNKFVTARLKNGRAIVTDGITTAPDRIIGNKVFASDYTRLSTLRITQAAVQTVRDISEPFIGEPNEMPQYNSLTASIKGGLDAMKEAKAINDYNFTVVTRGGTLTEAIVTLELVPAFELRKIAVNVSLSPDFQRDSEDI
ncbi:tail sheath protein [Bacillus phage vB_BauM_KLEB27-3]|nr:tail sheath protein [Bacillus phage vB_BauM_KLEB27-3]